MTKRLLFKMPFAFSILVVFFMAFATAAAWGQSRPSSGGTIRIAVAGDHTRNLDARYLGPPILYPAAMQIYEFLTGYGAKGMQEVIPGLAEGWKQQDPLTYLISLRKGVKFHNGREMIAEDIKTLLDWNLKTPEGWRPLQRRALVSRVVDKVEVVDRYSLRIRLKTPFAPFIAMLRAAEQGVAPPEEVKKWGKDFTLHPSGTGPFKFVELVAGDRVVLERFEGYWAKRPYLERAIFRTIPDEQSRIIALQTGELDVARLHLSTLPIARKDPKLKVREVVGLTDYLGLWFNMRKWPMSSLKFRQVVAMGAEWPKFTAATYAGALTRTPLERSWAENPKVKELLLGYDPGRARRLLKEVEVEAGRPIPPITFLAAAIYHLGQMGELAKTQLKRIGVELRVELREGVVPFVQALKWDLVLISSRGPGADPYFILDHFTSIGLGDMPDGKNMMGYVNPRIDDLLKQAAATEDRGQRAKIYQEMEEIIFKDFPGFYIYTPMGIWGMSKKIQELGVVDDGAIYLTTPWNNTWMER